MSGAPPHIRIDPDLLLKEASGFCYRSQPVSTSRRTFFDAVERVGENIELTPSFVRPQAVKFKISLSSNPTSRGREPAATAACPCATANQHLTFPSPRIFLLARLKSPRVASDSCSLPAHRSSHGQPLCPRRRRLLLSRRGHYPFCAVPRRPAAECRASTQMSTSRCPGPIGTMIVSTSPGA